MLSEPSPVRPAVAFLRGLSLDTARDPRVERHLAEAQESLRLGLEDVEACLAEVSALGPSPGSDAAAYLVRLGGKRVRPMAVYLVAGCVGGLSEAVRDVAVCVELIHSATLLHDDVLDEGERRRGEAAARVVWSNSISVLGGDLLLTHALLLAQGSAPRVLPLLLGALRDLVEGEVVQLRARQDLDFGRDAYETILRKKTGALFRLSAAGAACAAGASDETTAAMGEFGEAIGLAFQLIDDLLDYSGEATGKGLFADLRQGKVTLPLVLAIEREPALAQTIHRAREGDDEAVHALRRRVLELGCCEAVRERALGHTQQALSALEVLPASGFRHLLERLVLDLAARKL